MLNVELRPQLLARQLLARRPQLLALVIITFLGTMTLSPLRVPVLSFGFPFKHLHE
jgi:hypothetical protein